MNTLEIARAMYNDPSLKEKDLYVPRPEFGNKLVMSEEAERITQIVFAPHDI